MEILQAQIDFRGAMPSFNLAVFDYRLKLASYIWLKIL